jgi:hypothetical protein
VGDVSAPRRSRGLTGDISIAGGERGQINLAVSPRLCRGGSGATRRARIMTAMMARRRTITRMIVLVLLLVAGAIVNVAMAWAFVLRPTGLREIDRKDFFWPIAIPKGFERPTAVYGGGIASWGTTKLVAVVALRSGDTGTMDVLLAGWPCQSLYAERHGVVPRHFAGIPSATSFNSPRNFWQGVTIPWRDAHHVSCFPTIPVWPGFAINTLFYAAVLALLFFAPGRIRRFIRMKRGRCPACGYMIAPGTCSGGVCTECGGPVTQPPAAASV